MKLQLKSIAVLMRIALLASVGAALGQGTTATISGNVTDTSGAHHYRRQSDCHQSRYESSANCHIRQ